MNAKITVENDGKKVTIANFVKFGGIIIILNDRGILSFNDLHNNLKITKDMTRDGKDDVEIDLEKEIERMNHQANGLLTEKKREYSW
jgi:hypothetical protein